MNVIPERISITSSSFATTRWSVVLSSAGASEGAASHQALCQLCQIYWRPIFAFICHRGYQIADAQDLTQDFFVHVLEGDFFQQADPNRGRFRALLCKSLQHFLSDAHDRRKAKKRGGDRQIISLDAWQSEAPPSQLSFPADTLNWSAEKIFDLRWAATVAERALRQLREECEGRGRARVFDALREFLTIEGGHTRYVDVAAKLGVSEASIKTLVRRMRQRYRSLLRAEVSETLASHDDLDNEMRYLCDVLSVVS